MATDDDASAADPSGDGDDALEGDGDDLPSTREGDAVDRDAGTSSADEAGGLQPTGDDDRPADGSTAQPTAKSDGTSERSAATGEADDSEPEDREADTPESDGPRVAVGEYTWPDFLDEYGVDGDVETLYDGLDPRAYAGDDEENERWDDGVEIPEPTREDWDDVSVDAEEELGFHPVDTGDEFVSAIREAQRIQDDFEAFCDPETTPVVKDVWLWEHYKREYYYEDDGSRPRDGEGEIERFDETEALGFDPDAIEDVLAHGATRAEELDEVVEERTVDVNADLDEDAFFTDARGATTVVNRYDLEKAVPMEKKTHFREVERYWVNEPHSFVIIFHSTKENEKKYYAVEPHQNRLEADLAEYLTGKLRTAIKYDDESVVGEGPGTRRGVIEQQSLELLERYNLYQVPDHPRRTGLSVLATPKGDASDETSGDGSGSGLLSKFEFDLPFGSGDGDAAASGDGDAAASDNGDAAASDAPDPADDETPDATAAADGGTQNATSSNASQSQGSLASIARSLGLREGSLGGRLDGLLAGGNVGTDDPSLDGISARPEPAVLAEDSTELTDYQVEKLLYVLRRDFIGYERIDPIKHDVNVEDISCDGYNSPVFVYHSDYEQIISNIYHGEDELDDFVVKLAQRSGKGISKRRPQVDATLPDGSRAQLTLGREVSDHGTNYTIRQFKDVPFTPIDLINWKTFSLEEMAFLWLCIENDKSLIFAGGTASGKTTSLNAVSLFIPSNSKIVSIEDTREVELPQRNWVASVTRPSFSDDDRGDVDEFDLLEAALRQRPDYIVMGEIRGEEGRTLFQVMSTGHTTYTTFHADSVGEVLKRFTTDPINVSKTMFTALDLVSIQTSTRVQGNKVRRNKSLTEINHYDAENDEINVQDVYQWQAEGDEFLKMGSSNTLEDVRFDRGWTRAELDDELFKRHVVLAYLIDRGLNTYSQVAATLQAFINDQETILALMARDDLERSLEDLREMESVEINVDPEKEEMVPRPSPSEEIREICTEILERAEEELWPEYRDLEDVDVADALLDVETAPDVTAAPGEHPELDALEDRTEAPALDDGSATPEIDDGPDTPEIDGESETPALDPGPDESAAKAADDGITGRSADDDPPANGELGIEDLLEGPSGDEGMETLGSDGDGEADGDGDIDRDVDDGTDDGTDDTDDDGTDDTDDDGTDDTDDDGTDDTDDTDAESAEQDEDGAWDFGDVRQVDSDGEGDESDADEDESTETDR